VLDAHPQEPGEETLTQVHRWARSAELAARRDAGHQLSPSEFREFALGTMDFGLKATCAIGHRVRPARVRNSKPRRATDPYPSP
jgi:hypothetical protein